MTLTAWLLALGATIRLTRLLTLDTFPPVVWLRLRVMARFGSESSWYELVTCPWCMSFWAALAMLLFALFAGGSLVFLIITSALVFSLVAGYTANLTLG